MQLHPQSLASNGLEAAKKRMNREAPRSEQRTDERAAPFANIGASVDAAAPLPTKSHTVSVNYFRHYEKWDGIL